MIPISFSHTLSFFSFVSFIQLVLLASLAAIRGCIPTGICTNRELSSFPTPPKKNEIPCARAHAKCVSHRTMCVTKKLTALFEQFIAHNAISLISILLYLSVKCSNDMEKWLEVCSPDKSKIFEGEKSWSGYVGDDNRRLTSKPQKRLTWISGTTKWPMEVAV